MDWLVELVVFLRRVAALVLPVEAAPFLSSKRGGNCLSFDLLRRVGLAERCGELERERECAERDEPDREEKLLLLLLLLLLTLLLLLLLLLLVFDFAIGCDVRGDGEALLDNGDLARDLSLLLLLLRLPFNSLVIFCASGGGGGEDADDADGERSGRTERTVASLTPLFRLLLRLRLLLALVVADDLVAAACCVVARVSSADDDRSRFLASDEKQTNKRKIDTRNCKMRI